MPNTVWSGIRCAADIIQESRRTVVLTGAGVSTPSGIPDFRSPNSGIWEKFNPFEVASLTAFRYNPQVFYQWMRELAQVIYRCRPNPAHYSLARMEQAGVVKTIITQNVDALHHRAGSVNVLEIHGSLRTMTCTRCYQTVASDEYLGPYLETGAIPHCRSCGAVLKPDMVLMGEQLPSKTWLAAQAACRACDLMVVVGSSLEVLPVAGLPMRALENGAHLILINHSQTYLDVRADVILHEDSADVLPRIADAVLGPAADADAAPVEPVDPS
ncbi:MAG: SIR2 family NAD-dependent protein deacylase [Chloroflexota bacterium]